MNDPSMDERLKAAAEVIKVKQYIETHKDSLDTMEDINEMMARISQVVVSLMTTFGMPHDLALEVGKMHIYQTGIYYDARRKVEDDE